MISYSEMMREYRRYEEECRHSLELRRIQQTKFNTDEAETNSRAVKISELFGIVEDGSTDELMLVVSRITLNCEPRIGPLTHRDKVIILKLKDEYKYIKECLGVLSSMMTISLRHNIEYGQKLTDDMLMNESIPYIPFVPDKDVIDVSRLRCMFE